MIDNFNALRKDQLANNFSYQVKIILIIELYGLGEEYTRLQNLVSFKNFI